MFSHSFFKVFAKKSLILSSNNTCIGGIKKKWRIRTQITMKQALKPPYQAQNHPVPRLKVPDDLAKSKSLGKMVLSQEGNSDNTANTLGNFMRKSSTTRPNSKKGHQILAASPPILRAGFSSLDVLCSTFSRSFSRFLQCYH